MLLSAYSHTATVPYPVVQGRMAIAHAPPLCCRALPSSLLLLSRAFTITQGDEPRKKGAEYERLKETIGALPNKVITEAGMEAKTDE